MLTSVEAAFLTINHPRDELNIHLPLFDEFTIRERARRFAMKFRIRSMIDHHHRPTLYAIERHTPDKLKDCHSIWWRGHDSTVVQRDAGIEKGPPISSFTHLRQGLEIKKFPDGSPPPGKQNGMKLPGQIHWCCAVIR